MALNTNIALGVQPIQQPNMLAQYGQMMALRAAQQETQGNEELRAAYAQGGDLSDPAFRRRVMAANPKLGSQLINQFSEASARDVKTQAESLKTVKDSIGLVNSPSEMVEFLKGAYSTPGGALLSKLAPFERAVANIPQDPKSFEEYKKKFSLSADKLFTSAADELAARTRIQAANIGAAPGLMNAQLNRERFEYDKANPELILVPGDNGYYMANKRDPNSAVPLGMRPTAPPPPVAQPSAVNNLLMTTQPTPSVNALTQPAPNQAGPTVAAANALANQPTIIRPKQPIRQPVAVIKDGEVILVKPEEAVGMTPATPGAEKALEKKVIAKEGKESVNRVLSNLYSEYGNLVKSGGITDTRRSVEENISARTGASAVGQLTGSFTGSEAQSFRDSIEQTRPLLLTAIMKATGLSATQLNSNVELQTYLKTATDPKVSIQSNVKALNNISQMFGIGEKFEVPDIPKAEPKTAKPADAPPPGLSPEISGLWKYMTPEERKLWQK